MRGFLLSGEGVNWFGLGFIECWKCWLVGCGGIIGRGVFF